MTRIDRSSACFSDQMSCDELASAAQSATPDPRRKAAPSPASPSLSDSYGRQAAIVASQLQPATPAPLSAAECKLLPDAALDHQATALMSRLGRPADYPGRSRDTAELKNVEAELTNRESAKQAAAREAHGGVMLCKRVADLPGKDVHGAEHWWLETTRKSGGMGPATGNVPGHGESMPENFDTKLIDHSKEVATTCKPTPKPVDEDCVDRELQMGEATGTWTPLVNDCHTVVTRIIDKCNAEAIDKALEADAATRPGNGPEGYRR